MTQISRCYHLINNFHVSNFSLRQYIIIFGWFSSKNRLRNQLVTLFCCGVNSMPIDRIKWKMKWSWLSRTWNMKSESNLRTAVPRNITQIRCLHQTNVTWETVKNCILKDLALLSQVFFSNRIKFPMNKTIRKMWSHICPIHSIRLNVAICPNYSIENIRISRLNFSDFSRWSGIYGTVDRLLKIFEQI